MDGWAGPCTIWKRQARPLDIEYAWHAAPLEVSMHGTCVFLFALAVPKRRRISFSALRPRRSYQTAGDIGMGLMFSMVT